MAVACPAAGDGALLDVVTFQVRERIVVGRQPLEAVVLSSGVTENQYLFPTPLRERIAVLIDPVSNWRSQVTAACPVFP